MIDIRELRIGNHIMFNGTRVEVIGIEVSDDEDVPEIITVHEVLDRGEFDISCDLCEIDPIPITEELLKELMPESGVFERVGDVFGLSWEIGAYTFKVLNVGERISFEIHKYEYGYWIPVAQIMDIKYLHELEQFVFLTTKQELI